MQPGIDSDGSPSVDGEANDPTGNINTGRPNFDQYGLRRLFRRRLSDINGADTGPQIETTFDAPAGTYDIVVRLGNGATGTNGARPIDIVVDGVGQNVADTKTGDRFQREIRTVTVTLTGAAPTPCRSARPTVPARPNIDAVDRGAGRARGLPDHRPERRRRQRIWPRHPRPTRSGWRRRTLSRSRCRVSMRTSPDSKCRRIGAAFTSATLGEVTDGVALVTVDLSAITEAGTADIVFRVTDGADNTATTSVPLDFVEQTVVGEIQGETFEISDADGDTAAADNQPGFTGTGFMDMGLEPAPGVLRRHGRRSRDLHAPLPLRDQHGSADDARGQVDLGHAPFVSTGDHVR